MSFVLLIGGLFFPLISWFTLAACIVAARSGRSTSGVYVPFIGPALLNVWLNRTSAPGWVHLLPWIFDIGTIFFLVAAPRLFKEWWQTSRFTRLFSLANTQGNQSVKISFHRRSQYLLTSQWDRSISEDGIISMSEPGTYSRQDGLLILCSYAGHLRRLAPADGGYVVSDSGAIDVLQIEGWRLVESID